MIITGVFIARAYGKGVFQVLKKRYMNNFSNSQLMPKIYSVNGIAANLGKMLIGMIASPILNITTLSNALIIMGILCSIIMTILYFYSKNKLGLKPEEYPEKDIKLSV